MSFPGRAPTVLKFGGTSVASAARWRTIAEVVHARRRSGETPFLVCSALAGVSDQLNALLRSRDDRLQFGLGALAAQHEALATDLGVDVADELESSITRIHSLCSAFALEQELPAAVHAEVMAVGEFLSTRVGARYLESCGLRVRWLDARRLLQTKLEQRRADANQEYLSAACCYEPDLALRDRVFRNAPDVVVTQGFVACNRRRETVLLGRGGSDTAAAYLAAKLRARRLEVWTDVPGLFSADPRWVPNARYLPKLGYDEAETLAGLGAKVLHPRSLEPVRNAEIPVEVRWIDQPEWQGTRIDREFEMTEPGIRALASRADLCLISFNRESGWQPVGFMADVASCFKRLSLSMDLLASSPTSIQATLDVGAAQGASDRVPELIAELQSHYRPDVRFGLASVSVVGARLTESLDAVSSVLAELSGRSVHMVTLAGNDRSFTVVIEPDDVPNLMRRLHDVLIDCLEKGPSSQDLGERWIDLERANAGNGVARDATKEVEAPCVN